jgi:hypothetical protein
MIVDREKRVDSGIKNVARPRCFQSHQFVLTVTAISAEAAEAERELQSGAHIALKN